MFILKIDKVICFVTDLQVFILKVVRDCTEIVQLLGDRSDAAFKKKASVYYII